MKGLEQVYKSITMERHDTNQRAFWNFVCEQVTLIDIDLCSCDVQRQLSRAE